MALLLSLKDADGIEHDLKMAHAVPIFGLGDIYHHNGNVYKYAMATANLTAYSTLMTATVLGIDTVQDATTNGTYKGKYYGYLAQIQEAGANWSPGAFRNWKGLIDAGTGAGQVFEVEDNSAETLYLKRSLTTALAVADSDITIFNPHRVALATASVSTPIVGIANRAINYLTAPYFWMQTGGIAAVLNGATDPTAGIYSTTGDDTAGTVTPAAATTGLEDANIVGVPLALMLTATNDTPIWLKLNFS